MKKIKNIKIEKTVYGGYGLGYSNDKTIFIRLGIPGDILDVIVIDEKKNYSFAEIENIVQPSTARIDPVCKNFGFCGGCSYLNVNYETEIEFKKNALLDNLKRIAGLDEEKIEEIENEIDVIKSDRFHYRSHATIKSSKSKPGFYKKGTNVHVPFGKEGCILLDEKLNEFIINESFSEKDTRIAIDRNNDVFAFGSKKDILEEYEYDVTYQRGLDQFFQVNKYLRTEMLSLVKEFASLKDSDKFVDFGCGVGFFSMVLGKEVLSGIGVDLSEESIKWARKNAQLNNLENIKFYKQSISDFNKFNYNPDVIVVDPPRSGISKKGRRTILKLAPNRIVYVSCNPSTFSRDIKDFIKDGYELEKINLIDMFPCTHHIEVISVLSI